METMKLPTKKIECVRAAAFVLSDKWTPQLLRWIHNREKSRFCELQTDVGGINPRTLSARLAALEQQGIIEKVSQMASKRDCYALTEKGEALLPILDDMAVWSKRFSETQHTV